MPHRSHLAVLDCSTDLQAVVIGSVCLVATDDPPMEAQPVECMIGSENYG